MRSPENRIFNRIVITARFSLAVSTAVGATCLLLETLGSVAYANTPPVTPSAAATTISSTTEKEYLVNYKGKSPLVGSILVETLGQDAIQVNVASDVGASATVFSVDNPARLVIDLPFRGSRVHALKKPARLESAPNSLVTAVRIAAHDSKVRIVLDLQGEVAPPYSVESRSKNLVVRLGAGIATSGAVASPRAAVETFAPPTATFPAPTPLPPTPLPPTPLPTSTPKPPREPEATASVSPQASDVSTATTSPPPEGVALVTPPPLTVPAHPTASELVGSPPTEHIEVISGPALVGILFNSEVAGKEPVVRLTLNHRPRFRLARRDERSYRLRIEDCALGTPRARLPYFPPQDFVGFTMIQASQVGSAVEVVIGADRGTRISATPDDSDILLRATR